MILRSLSSLARLHIHFHSQSQLDFIDVPGCAALLEIATIRCGRSPTSLACSRLARATALTSLTLEEEPESGVQFLPSCPQLRSLCTDGHMSLVHRQVAPLLRTTGLQRLCMGSGPGQHYPVVSMVSWLASLPT
jgi:hypothetical protein